MIQVFGTKKCQATKAAVRFFKERRIPIRQIDITVKPPSPAELEAVAKALGGYRLLIDRQSAEYQRLGLAWQEIDDRQMLLDHPLVAKTPFVRLGSRAVVGQNPDGWQALLKTLG